MGCDDFLAHAVKRIHNAPVKSEPAKVASEWNVVRLPSLPKKLHNLAKSSPMLFTSGRAPAKYPLDITGPLLRSRLREYLGDRAVHSLKVMFASIITSCWNEGDVDT